MSDAEIISHIRSVPLKGSQIDNIVADSLPIISFGDFRTADVLTLGLNPSLKEFPNDPSQDRGLKRLSSKSSSKLTDLANEEKWSDDEIMEIYTASTRYFDCKGVRDDGSPAWKHNAYWEEWFMFPEIALNIAGASYKRFLGNVESRHNLFSAAHVDISPWATDPVWSDLDKEDKEVTEALQSHNSKFLTKQLLSPNVKYILALGTAMDLLLENFGFEKRNLGSKVVNSMRVDAKFQLIKDLKVSGVGSLPTIYYCSKSPSFTRYRKETRQDFDHINSEISWKRSSAKEKRHAIYSEFGRLIKTHLDTGQWSVNGE